MVSSYNETVINFRYRESNRRIDQLFAFDFRYYLSYQSTMGGKSSGVYTFKTSDKDSRPYPHKIYSIQTKSSELEGGLNHKTQQFLIRYEDNLREMSFVKVKLKESFEQDCEPIEFDVEFSGLVSQDMDVTINWKMVNSTLRIEDGVFYTDSNGLGMVKRIPKNVDKDGNALNVSAVAANYYPVNFALFVED